MQRVWEFINDGTSLGSKIHMEPGRFFDLISHISLFTHCCRGPSMSFDWHVPVQTCCPVMQLGAPEEHPSCHL
jgi:hypothetical protein